MSDIVTYTQEDGVAILELDDGKANAFGHALCDELSEALDRAEKDASAVAIFGRPGLFSGGFDLGVMAGTDQAAKVALGAKGAKLLVRVYGHPQPVVMGSTGHAVALGAFFLLTADYRVGLSGDFKYNLNEAAKGMPLPQFAFALSKARLSPTHITDVVLNSAVLTPEQAQQAGFLDELATADSLRETVLAKARLLGSYDAANLVTVKQGLRAAVIAELAPFL